MWNKAQSVMLDFQLSQAIKLTTYILSNTLFSITSIQEETRIILTISNDR